MPGTDSFVPKLYQGVERESKAFKMMQTMGWNEGKGLGKDGQGIVTHVRVSKKFDSTGLGVAEERKKAADWSVNTVVFDSILKNLNVKISNSVANKVDSSDSDSDSESESDSDIEKSKTQANVEVKRIVRPQGRYKRYESGKSVKGYSKTDLAAILGSKHPASPEQKSTNIPSPSKVSSPVKSIPSPSPVDEPVSTLQSLSSHPQSRILVESETLQTERSTRPAINSTPWWGDKFGFVRAGQLGAARIQTKHADSVTAGKSLSEPSANPRASFNEQDQEDLYNLVQNNATTGRRGLGVGDLTQKVFKTDWKGSKVKFDDTDDEVSVREADGCVTSEVTNPFSSAVENQSKVKDSSATDIIEDIQGVDTNDNRRKRKRKESVSVEKSEASEPIDGGSSSQLKLKKLASEALKKAPNKTLTFKRLKKEVYSMAFRVQNGSTPTKQEIASSLLKKLEKSSKFSIEGKHVKILS